MTEQPKNLIIHIPYHPRKKKAKLTFKSWGVNFWKNMRENLLKKYF